MINDSIDMWHIQVLHDRFKFIISLKPSFLDGTIVPLPLPVLFFTRCFPCERRGSHGGGLPSFSLPLGERRSRLLGWKWLKLNRLLVEICEFLTVESTPSHPSQKNPPTALDEFVFCLNRTSDIGVVFSFLDKPQISRGQNPLRRLVGAQVTAAMCAPQASASMGTSSSHGCGWRLGKPNPTLGRKGWVWQVWHKQYCIKMIFYSEGSKLGIQNWDDWKYLSLKRNPSARFYL